MFGIKTDPVPYIAAAYGIGIVILVFYSALQIKLRKKLRMLELAIHEGDTPR